MRFPQAPLHLISTRSLRLVTKLVNSGLIIRCLDLEFSSSNIFSTIHKYIFKLKCYNGTGSHVRSNSRITKNLLWPFPTLSMSTCVIRDHSIQKSAHPLLCLSETKQLKTFVSSFPSKALPTKCSGVTASSYRSNRSPSPVLTFSSLTAS